MASTPASMTNIMRALAELGFTGSVGSIRGSLIV